MSDINYRDTVYFSNKAKRDAEKELRKDAPKGWGNCPGCNKLFKLKAGLIPIHHRPGGLKCGVYYGYGRNPRLPVK